MRGRGTVGSLTSSFCSYFPRLYVVKILEALIRGIADHHGLHSFGAFSFMALSVHGNVSALKESDYLC